MGKIKKSPVQTILNKWKEEIELLEKCYSPWPTISHSVNISFLVDELLNFENIPKELLHKISKLLGERWLRVSGSE